MAVVADHARVEPLAEEVPPAAVLHVELLGVDAVQSLHPRREAVARGLHDQVVVVRHQADGVELPVVSLGDEREEGQEEEVVVVVQEDRRAGDAARGDVVDPPRR